MIPFLFCLCLLLGHSFARAQESPPPAPAPAPQRTLRLVITDFPPFMEMNSEAPHGLLTDKAVRIIEKAGYKAEIVYYPLKRLAQELIAGDADVWMGTANYEVYKDGAFIGSVPVLKLKLSLWSLGKKEVKIKDVEDFKHHPVAFIAGYTYGGLAEKIKDPKNKIKYYEIKDIPQAIKLLQSGRAEVFLEYDVVMQEWRKQNPRRQFSSFNMPMVLCYIVVSRKTLDAAEILKRLEKALVEVDQDPTVIR